MPDHWYALIYARHSLTVSRVLQDAKYASARRINFLRQTRGALWQYQFWDRFVRHEREFRQGLDDMQLNPVRKALVAAPGDWRWSNYNSFDPAKGADCPIQVDQVLLPEGYRG